MDKSETYIKMMKGALKDLNRYVPRDDDGCLAGRQDCGIDKESGKLVPLFRQDQLQEIYLDGKQMLACDLALRFGEYEGFSGALLANENTSMEQLWLAFCMSEKFGKIWSGTEWVKK